MGREIKQNKIDGLLNRYYSNKNIALLNELDELRKEQKRILGPKLKQSEIDQIVEEEAK